MKEQIVRAGKYASVGFILVASLPVLIPLLFLLSFLGFAFVLPLGCTVAGLLYLRKYARVLYRVTIGAGGGASGSRGRIAAAPPRSAATLSELSPEDSRRIETFEEVDQELDAVVVSTLPKVEYWGKDAGRDAGTGGSENGNRRDGGGEHASEQVAEEEEEDGEGPVVGSSRSVVIGSRNGEVQEEEGRGPNYKPLSEEGEAYSRAVVDGSSDQENSAVSIGDVGKGGVPEDSAAPAAPADSAGSHPSPPPVFDSPPLKKGALPDSTGDEIVDSYATVTAHGRSPEAIEDPQKSPGGEETEDKTYASVTAHGRSPEAIEDGEKSAGSEETEDKTYASVTAHGRSPEALEDGEKSAGGEETEDKTYASVTAHGISPEAIEDPEKSPGVDETEDNAKGDNIEAQAGDFDSHASVSRREMSLELVDDHRERTVEGGEGREDSGDKDGKLDAQADDGAHQQLNEELEVGDQTPTPVIHEAGVESKEIKEGKIEALPDDESELGVADQEQGRGDASPRTPVGTTTRPADDEAPEESKKPDSIEVKGASSLLPNQADENDIWICRDCGWKYPNAKPSAKIRRNHKKHCQGRSPSPRNGRPSETDVESSGEFAKVGRDEDVEGDKYTGALSVTGDDSVSEGSSKEIDMKSMPDDSVSEGDKRGPHTRQSVAFDEAALAAPSGHDGEESGSAVACDSFRSAPDESASVASESFRSASDEFHGEIGRSSSLPSETPNFEDEQNQLTQVQEVQQLRDDLNTMKQIVGDEQGPAGPLLIDIEELSEFLGIALPSRSADMSEIEWAKKAVEGMKIVVGVD